MNLLRSLRPFHPIHLALAGAFCALLAAGALVLKVYLTLNFVPETTYDASGAAIMNGPYSYDNQLLDGIFVVGILLAVAMLAAAGSWIRMRPMS